ncbi:glycoside hydrolase family 108 protein [Mesorhizobium amorphae]|uniref:glycoside hydrolase family 108 protein n=1 Tax=Mesorhizobium amorphae TaxID=71433 RepID=UPI00118464F8|nr:glycosyl hydrolase 108 family protein [Mesorhizobium amorphae]
MDRNFARALSLVLKSEGGWSDHPDDPGGATMNGVTLANFRRFVKPDATKADLHKITAEQVATVYRRYYWDAVAGAELPGGIDYAVFDFAVNSGPKRAAEFLQGVVGAKQDGKIGPDTLKAVRGMMRAAVINDLCDKRMVFLGGLGTWKTFGKGWTRRVSEVRTEALKLAAQPDKDPPVVVEKPIETPVVPKEVDKEVKKTTGLWGWLTTIFGSGGAGLAGFLGADWQTILAIGAVALGVLLLLILLRRQIIGAVQDIRGAVEG